MDRRKGLFDHFIIQSLSDRKTGRFSLSGTIERWRGWSVNCCSSAGESAVIQ